MNSSSPRPSPSFVPEAHRGPRALRPQWGTRLFPRCFSFRITQATCADEDRRSNRENRAPSVYTPHLFFALRVGRETVPQGGLHLAQEHASEAVSKLPGHFSQHQSICTYIRSDTSVHRKQA